MRIKTFLILPVLVTGLLLIIINSQRPDSLQHIVSQTHQRIRHFQVGSVASGAFWRKRLPFVPVFGERLIFGIWTSLFLWGEYILEITVGKNVWWSILVGTYYTFTEKYMLIFILNIVKYCFPKGMWKNLYWNISFCKLTFLAKVQNAQKADFEKTCSICILYCLAILDSSWYICCQTHVGLWNDPHCVYGEIQNPNHICGPVFCQEMEEITCFLSFLTTLFALILTLFLFVHLTPLPRRLVYEKIFSYEFSLLWHFACTLKTKTYAVAKIKMEYRVPCKCDAHNFHSIIHTQLS